MGGRTRQRAAETAQLLVTPGLCERLKLIASFGEITNSSRRDSVRRPGAKDLAGESVDRGHQFSQSALDSIPLLELSKAERCVDR